MVDQTRELCISKRAKAVNISADGLSQIYSILNAKNKRDKGKSRLFYSLTN